VVEVKLLQALAGGTPPGRAASRPAQSRSAGAFSARGQERQLGAEVTGLLRGGGIKLPPRRRRRPGRRRRSGTAARPLPRPGRGRAPDALAPHEGGSRLVPGVGDDLVPGPGPLVVGGQLPAAPGADPVQPGDLWIGRVQCHPRCRRTTPGAGAVPGQPGGDRGVTTRVRPGRFRAAGPRMTSRYPRALYETAPDHVRHGGRGCASRHLSDARHGRSPRHAAPQPVFRAKTRLRANRECRARNWSRAAASSRSTTRSRCCCQASGYPPSGGRTACCLRALVAPASFSLRDNGGAGARPSSAGQMPAAKRRAHQVPVKCGRRQSNARQMPVMASQPGITTFRQTDLTERDRSRYAAAAIARCTSARACANRPDTSLTHPYR
jgi:hypothetical protein